MRKSLHHLLSSLLLEGAPINASASILKTEETSTHDVDDDDCDDESSLMMDDDNDLRHQLVLSWYHHHPESHQ